MIFSSYEFVFAFLPVVLLGTWLLRFTQGRVIVGWLALTSLFFYGYWNPNYLVILIGSALVNYIVGRQLFIRATRLLLWSGILFNLALIGYFKYANFAVDTVGQIVEASWNLKTIVLPLAISFFTFQQIAYLVDAYRGEAIEGNPLRYLLFVSFYPQLIAGPIVHHREMMPQLAGSLSLNSRNLAIGLSIFSIGLFKKLLIADNVGVVADSIFDAAASGADLSVGEAWLGALAYTSQLYFDFSGYSDMAIGLAKMLGVNLPVNFLSPYKAVSITDFWRRWHITLSRFLRDYLYIPLGGNRRGTARRYVNLMLTMVLGGLWHGAGWQFIVWGGLHGGMLVINQFWLSHKRRIPWMTSVPLLVRTSTAVTLTFLSVIVGWVYFRSADLSTAHQILASMFAPDYISLPRTFADKLAFTPASIVYEGMFPNQLLEPRIDALMVFASLLACFAMPNNAQIFGSDYGLGIAEEPETFRSFKLNTGWAILIGSALAFSILSMGGVQAFLYFQF